MGFFGSFSGSTQRKDMRTAYADSNKMMDDGYASAQGSLEDGYTNALAAFDTARGDVGAGYQTATNALTAGTDKAAGYLEPYIGSGQQANTMYNNALGINGPSAQQEFGQNFAANDPFRQQNADFATEALMRSLNARGMSGGGYAAQAVSRENLARGSTDYQNYLTRLQGASSQGMQASSVLADLYNQAGQKQATMDYGYGSDLANISGQKAQTGYTYGQNKAGLETDLATAKAGNRINLGNSLANSRSILTNNLLGVTGVAAKAFGAK